MISDRGWVHIEKEHRTQYRTLKNAIQQIKWLRFTTKNRNNLLSPTKIWLKERKITVMETRNVSLFKWLSSMKWFIISNAALRSRRVKIRMWSESLLVKTSLKTRRKAVSVLCRDRYTDWKTCHKLLFSKCTASSWERTPLPLPPNSFDTKGDRPDTLGSRGAFFRRDLTMAHFNESGTEPVESRSLTISVNAGQSHHYLLAEATLGWGPDDTFLGTFSA